MSFSSPTTYASTSNTGYLAQFLLGDTSSPPSYTAIAEIKSFSLDPISMAEIPATHLLSPSNTEEFIPSMIKPGKCSASGNFLGDASQLAITTKAQAQTIFSFKVVAPVQRNTKTYTFLANGFITAYKPGPFEINKMIEFSMEIQITGAYTETVV